MTESNKTYRKSSRNTAVALFLGGAAIIASGFLVMQVNSLDRRYGRIEENLTYYTEQLNSEQQRLEIAREQYRELSDRIQNLDQEVASAENNRQSAAQREADAVARLEQSQAELTAVQERLAEARRIIAEAERLDRETTAALERKADLDVEIADLEDDVEQLDARQRDLSTDVETERRALDTLEGRRSGLRAEVDRLGNLMIAPLEPFAAAVEPIDGVNP